MPALFLGTTTALPPKPADQEFILLSEGLDEFDGPEHVPLELCSFAMVIGCLLDDYHEAAQAIEDRWREWFGTPITLELLSVDPSELQRHVRRGFHKYEAGAVFLNGRALAYRTSSEKARQQAYAVIHDGVFRKRWKVWQ